MPTATLEPNAFIGRKELPDDDAVANALGAAKPVWDRLLADMATKHEAAIQEWKCYSPKAGWALRLIRGKRTILWLAPCIGCFRVAVILGDKAVLAAREGGLSARELRLLDEAEKYPEGTGIRLHIRTLKELPTVMKLAVIKLAN